MSTGWAAIARFGGIGDNLIASAVLPGLRAKYGRVEVITQHPQHVVFENNPYVDKLAAYKPGDIPGGSSAEWQGWFARRAKEYDFFANLSHTCETLRALTAAQTQFYYSAEFRRKMCGQSYIETVADVCGVPYDTLSPGFYPTDAEHEDVLRSKTKFAGRRAIGWVLSGTRIDKIYPYAPSTVARLIREVGPVIMLGGPPPMKDLAMANAIADYVYSVNGSKDGLLTALSPSLANEVWPMRRLLTLAQHCDVIVTPDTGPAWAVAMLDTPKIVLLSHASTENITKYWRNTVTLHADPARVPCWPCHQLHDTSATCRPNRDNNGAACISDISVERIVTEVAHAWKRENDDATHTIHRSGDRVVVEVSRYGERQDVGERSSAPGEGIPAEVGASGGGPERSRHNGSATIDGGPP